MAPTRGLEQPEVVRHLATGRQMFCGLELLCGPGALVPRPETELLARVSIDWLRSRGLPPRVIDMCCGTGNLACAIATALPDARVWASDLTDDCIAWTRRNVDHLDLSGRVEVAQGDLFAPLRGRGLEGTIDAIVCNPPYISTGRLSADRAALLDHEPREAFDGGPYGLSIHQRVIHDARLFLRPGGALTMEFGLGQERQIRLLLERTRAYTDLTFSADPLGSPRVVRARTQS